VPPTQDSRQHVKWSYIAKEVTSRSGRGVAGVTSVEAEVFNIEVVRDLLFPSCPWTTSS